MSTEEEADNPGDKEPAMTPQQMLEKTKQLFENFVGKTRKIGTHKQESSDCSSPELKTGKRRRVQLKDSSSEDDFGESPLRKSLSPISPTNKRHRKVKCTRKSAADSSPLSSSRYKTRTGKAPKKISYADIPEMENSDTDFDSPKRSDTSSEWSGS